MRLSDRIRFLNEKTWAWSSAFLVIAVFLGFGALGLGAIGFFVAVCVPFMLAAFRKPSDRNS